MLTEPIARAEQIAKLNDRARSGFDPSARIMFTRGCLDAFCSGDTPSGLVAQAELIKTMRRHRFEEDTYGERDFGAFTFRGEKVFFKVDYYDLNLEYGSEDPADASITARVVTIMLAAEY
jgi:hypothetical protein